MVENYWTFGVSSVQSLSRVWLFVTPWTAARHVYCQRLETTQLHVHQISDEHHIIQPSNPLSSSHLQSFPASGSFPMTQFILWGGQSIGSFNFSISLSKEFSGLSSFRIDGLCLLEVQGTLKNLLQHHISKASVLWCSAFLRVQLLHPYMTTGKL